MTAADANTNAPVETPSDSFDLEFGRQIARAREQAGMSQRRLADELSAVGLSLDSAAVSRMEKGKRSPKLEEAVAISDVLEMPLAAILPPKPDAIRLAQARQNVEKHLDDAMYKVTAAAGYLEYFATIVEASPEVAQQVFRDESPAARFDWEGWATWTIDSLASSPTRRVASADDERAHAIRRVLEALVRAVITSPIDLVDTSGGVPSPARKLRTRKPRTPDGVDQATS